MQGVGFRPFIYRLAERFSLPGWVRNGPEGVRIEIQGSEPVLDQFLRAVRDEAPPLALITAIRAGELPLQTDTGFTIVASSAGTGTTLVSPDCDVCPDCLQELFDPADRRFRYPFINCTNCGPRYSIITALPYDRPNTTMAGFPLCRDCRTEYEDPSNRRFHAQPVACPVCGPRLALLDDNGRVVPGEPLAIAVQLLQAGEIVAVKGIGGYHLAVDPFNSAAVGELRRRKMRDEKPFALMTENLTLAARFVQLDDLERRFLTGTERPILLARKQPGNGIAPNVAPANDWFGIMLPSSPLQYLLLRDNFSALIMTSANLSDDPVIHDDQEALSGLRGIADYFLVHDRNIHAPCDDSVIRVFRNHPLMMRRSRGHVPRGIQLPAGQRSVLATGGELKSAICLAAGDQAFMSRHLGDLKSPATLAAFQEAIQSLEKITGITPALVAHDLHPDYHSTLYAASLPGIPKIPVQHHHAHMAACMAENRLEGDLIGVIFDGTGLGSDGTVWGGEFLTGDYRSFTRMGHLHGMVMPGGDAAAREPFRMAIALLHELHGSSLFDLPLGFLATVPEAERKLFLQMITKGINSPRTSSCGRLFDAVAALIGVRNRMSYEGQAAIELEGIAERGTAGIPYPLPVATGADALTLDWRPMIGALLQDILDGRSTADMAATFHHSLAIGSVAMCREIRSVTGLDRVVISGGVFQNRLLSEALWRLLQEDDFKVYCHRLIPPNDGGLALGQAVIAGRSD